MKTTSRLKLSPDEIRAALLEIGLKEVEKPIDGYAFGYLKQPRDAVSFYEETHGGTEPTRFYCGTHSFILSD